VQRNRKKEPEEDEETGRRIQESVEEAMERGSKIPSSSGLTGGSIFLSTCKPKKKTFD